MHMEKDSHNCLEWLQRRYPESYDVTNHPDVKLPMIKFCEKHNHNLVEVKALDLYISKFDFLDGNGFVNILDATEKLSPGEMIKIKVHFSQMYNFGLALNMFSTWRNDDVIDIIIRIMKYDIFKINFYKELELDREYIIMIMLADIFKRKVKNVPQYIKNAATMMGDNSMRYFYGTFQWAAICDLLDRSADTSLYESLRGFIRVDTRPFTITHIFIQLGKITSRDIMKDFGKYAAAFHPDIDIETIFRDLARLDKKGRIFILTKLHYFLLNQRNKNQYLRYYDKLLDICKATTDEETRYAHEDSINRLHSRL
ncbi:MAG: hypothetical protein Harvfovirus3_77 [Harvfovirus sp.]|uniref:Uncharacterized protein n=1 Tax=Harvfovirus sp. TaxID=2487768 RepID=A0A3G5A0E9_9VIRU|nr:MAG: hypothetical protein Harvfovirus3_77 [Harvfovirus sp.]